MKTKVAVFWFRRDLRLHDNVGLYNALQSNYPVLPIFIFDKNILEALEPEDPRVSFLHNTLQTIREELKAKHKSSLGLYFGDPIEVFKLLSKNFSIQKVFTNRDYEPYASERDKEIQQALENLEIPFKTYKDQVIFEKDEVVKDDGKPYVVYTPYMRKWKALFAAQNPKMSYDSRIHLDHCIQDTDLPNLSLSEIGFCKSEIKVKPYFLTPSFVGSYANTRNLPAAIHGTSRLGPHLRFGTVSIRQIVTTAQKSQQETFWNELIWREFFMQILWHFPKTIQYAFKPKYDRIKWRNDPDDFVKWKNGNTGYPLVDAGMRELNATGYMHNRVRMLVASFLCKHLLIDWRWGEAYFAQKLLDFELSSNVGNWQWAAGSGVDAAPYFRIFNPTTQVVKFDKDLAYIQKWVPELQELTYPNKMVDHKMARERCLAVYKQALQ
ncbi:cryptochrome/photolyase family protein [Eudoraea chungangensis]|uniref:cryptochrome/photolyase family protein n=1 Tax=Eudoraea chungangensis TaxID=1481905 RepID=UPI0023EB39F7|nr:deoxyribodipyrimidine photo-lyase [Eudoraea chungangensis]